MCLSIPCKVIRVEGDWAEVEASGHSHRVYIKLVKNVKVGDYLMLHNNLAINKVERNEVAILKNLTLKIHSPTFVMPSGD